MSSRAFLSVGNLISGWQLTWSPRCKFVLKYNIKKNRKILENIVKAKGIFSKELFTAANFNKMFKEGKYSHNLSSLVDFLFDIYDYKITEKEKVSVFIGLS